ncbi:hypothetical protein CRM22_011063, partial [Opisthorchis felineus]
IQSLLQAGEIYVFRVRTGKKFVYHDFFQRIQSPILGMFVIPEEVAEAAAGALGTSGLLPDFLGLDTLGFRNSGSDLSPSGAFIK